MNNFSVGERIRLRNELFHFRRKLDENRWQLEKSINGEYLIIEESELYDLYCQKLLTFANFEDVKPISKRALDERIAKIFADYPENLQQVARKRLKYIQAAEGLKISDFTKQIEIIANKLGDDKPPSFASVSRWTSALKKSGNNICCLIPNYAGRGNKTPRYDEQIGEIAIQELIKIYLCQNRGSLKDTLASVRNRINLKNKQHSEDEKLPVPSVKYLRNIVDKMDKYEVMAARYGLSAAKRYFREAIKSGEIIAEALERVEIDHTSLDLIVVDPKTYLPMGRPTLTIAFDRCTRCVLGFCVSFEPPNYISVMNCLAHSIRPKSYLKSKYPEIEHTWPCWGLPTQIVVDNGKEFHSRDLEAAAHSLMIEIRFCPVKQPWWKGGVERFLRTVSSDLIHKLPGTTFGNVEDKGDYNSLKAAAISSETLDEIIHTWICDIYHQTIHHATLRTPQSLWLERVNSVTQNLPQSAELLDISLSSVEHKTLFHYGVGQNNLYYNSPQLMQIRRKFGNLLLEIRWNRSDLGAVHVLDPAENVYIRVPCTWYDYAAGISLWLHNIIREEAKQHEGPENQAKLDAAKSRIRELCEKAMSNKKLVTRKTAARAQPSFCGDNSNNQEQINRNQYALPPGVQVKPTAFELDSNTPENIPDFDISERN